MYMLTFYQIVGHLLLPIAFLNSRGQPRLHLLRHQHRVCGKHAGRVGFIKAHRKCQGRFYELYMFKYTHSMQLTIKTMVFTHLPSAVFLALIPVPSTPTFSLLFLVLRACTQSMDVAPRSAFLAAMLLPNERTAIMGTVNVVKTTAQAAGPLITGVLANNNLFWVSFVCAGSLKALYDLGLLIVFKNHARVKDTERQEQNEAVEA